MLEGDEVEERGGHKKCGPQEQESDLPAVQRTDLSDRPAGGAERQEEMDKVPHEGQLQRGKTEEREPLGQKCP